jgi:ribonuclease BN (tRNA processing enzyme)
MKIKVVGAAGGEVTGSGYFVQTDRARILIDAGMFQGGEGSEAKNRIPAGVSLPSLDAVLLTHAHLDHPDHITRSAGAGSATSWPLITSAAGEMAAGAASRATRRPTVFCDGPHGRGGRTGHHVSGGSC